MPPSPLVVNTSSTTLPSLSAVDLSPASSSSSSSSSIGYSNSSNPATDKPGSNSATNINVHSDAYHTYKSQLISADTDIGTTKPSSLMFTAPPCNAKATAARPASTSIRALSPSLFRATSVADLMHDKEEEEEEASERNDDDDNDNEKEDHNDKKDGGISYFPETNSHKSSLMDISRDGFMDDEWSQYSTASYNNDADADNNERVQEDIMIPIQHSVSFHKESQELLKLITLQSIDRLESHLPHIVVRDILQDMQKAKEQRQMDKEGDASPLGAMTLEVPMQIGGNNSIAPSIVDALPATAATTTSSSAQSHHSRGSSRGTMSELLNTLASLDELLEEEFSSGSSSSEEEESSDGSYSGSSEEDSSELDDEDTSDYEDEEALGASALTFGSGVLPGECDDGVSDIEDGISDIGSVMQDNDDSSVNDGYEEEGPSCCNSGSNGVNNHNGKCALRPSHHRRITTDDRSADSGAGSLGATSFLSRAAQSKGSSSRRCNGRSSQQQQPAEAEVGKLRQGRLNYRRLESDGAADDRSMSEDLTTLSTNTDRQVSLSTEVRSSQHVSAILFVDISGFTKLSRSLEVEALSKVINRYFQMIVNEIKRCGGDVLKFAGDALIVEWTQDMLPEGQKHLPVALLAALCASNLVDQCSDYPVERDGQHISTLNLHCALGFGPIVGAHCGDMDRMEYLIMGDAMRQVSEAMGLAKLGEVVASSEAMAALAECVQLTEPSQAGSSYTLAFKGDPKFSLRNSTFCIPNMTRPLFSEQCDDWTASELEDLQRRMSRYVHSVVYSDEFSKENPMLSAVASSGSASSSAASRRMSMTTCRKSSNAKNKQAQSELRDVFTVFIQPQVNVDLNGESAGDDETLQLLNSIMFIVNSEVLHHKGSLRQYIVDDKGLVVIANFGLKGSTFPNMIEERAIPCISNIRTLLKTELDLECKMGATMGNAYCGVVGGVTRHEYAILGPSVNLAARLMANSSNPGILVDETVKSKAGERPFLSLAPVKAKGYDDMVKIFSPADNIRKAWKNVAEEFVGRQMELNSLKETATSVMGNSFSSKTIFISGPYGIGKSYLLSQAAAEIEESCRKKDVPHHVSRLVFNENDSFRPFSIVRPLFLDLLRRKQHIPSFGAAQTAGHDENLGQKAEVEEAQLYVSLLQICLEAQVPMQYIEMFGGLIFSTKLSDIGTWSERNRKMSEWNAIAKHLVTAFIHCTADYGLVLLALDDVSGCDEMSWKILQKLYRRAGNLLVLGTARNEFDLNINAEFWGELNGEGIDDGSFRHIRLAPMELQDVARLAGKRMGKSASELDAAVCKTVHTQSRGNPLLACEILDVMYIDDDSKETSASGASLSKIEELLLNRLDELSPVDRSHLNLGAILGVSFDEQDIVSVMEQYNDIEEDQKAQHAQTVHSSLQVSVNFGILTCSQVGEKLTYKFVNALWMKTCALHILDSWKDEMRALIDVATDVTTSEGDMAIKFDWDELASIKAGLSSMRQQNHCIQQSIEELRSLINRAR